MTSISAQLSPEMEDYLETIANLFHTTGQARVTDIAKRLSVRKASVTQALHALADKGLIHYQPYVAPTLTDAGKRIATSVQRRHDLLKRFFVDVLLIDPEVAEANACRMEHAVDTEVLDHLTKYMDFVHSCPRAGAKLIQGYEYSCDPENDAGKCKRCMTKAIADFQSRPSPAPLAETASIPLSKLGPGKSGRIVRVGSLGVMRRRLVDMGAVQGTLVTMVKVAPLGDPMEIKIKGYSLTLRKEEAEAIEVQALNPEAPAD